MQTLKTAIVVVLLLVVFYGVYEMLNRPPVEPPRAVAELPPEAYEELAIEEGDLSGLIEGGTPSTSPDPLAYEPYDTPPTDPDIPEVSIDPEVTLGQYHPPSQPPGGGHYAPPPLPPETQSDSAAPPPVPPQDLSAWFPVFPGGPQMQDNPYFNGDAVPKPRSELGALAYQRALKTAQSRIADGDYRTALGELSAFYKSQDLTAEQHRELLDLLDPLAGQVIYSREHLLERPYTVRRNETLTEIAAQYNVPYQLLQKINGIENPNVLLPGSELKVVPGPFRADVNLETQELTVFLDRYYAGRFPITLGIDPQPSEGQFQVREKRPGKTYFSLDGRTIPAESPANPFGTVWLDLGREVCIHGSPIGGAEQKRGCISLSPRDASDVYSILSVGSKIRILR